MLASRRSGTPRTRKKELNIAPPASTLAIIPIHERTTAGVLTIGGRSVLDATVRALRAVPAIGPIVLALENVDPVLCLEAIPHPEDLQVIVTASLPDRWRAIAAALEIEPSLSTVLLHAPERPLLTPASLNALLDGLTGDGALFGIPVHETIKRVVGGRIVATVPRESLHVSQLPCAFRRAVVARATQRAIEQHWTCENEVQLARAAGIRLQLVSGQRFNLPITSALDARYAELRSSPQLEFVGAAS